MIAVSRLLAATALALALATLLGACSSQEALTANAIDCSRREVDVLKSRYKDQGITTTWCAACRGERYRCVSNADRSRAECRAAQPGDGC
jgi:hypothetical protein